MTVVFKNCSSVYRNVLYSIVIILLFSHTFQSCAFQIPDDDRLMEKKSHELATWILSQLNQPVQSEFSDYTSGNQQDLCQSQPNMISKRKMSDNYLYRLNASKRNSELINSLLRLPKTMNEVGRK
ncbi:protein PDF-like [Chrysoperla carnea]|uniref:protein PDF-like n=1 Tax=Chrysoperla carnea TaxID=189513 RepID=UPI001D05E804|nr:protein PDF-like [Chrysoperla carnea]